MNYNVSIVLPIVTYNTISDRYYSMVSILCWYNDNQFVYIFKVIDKNLSGRFSA